MTKSTKYRVNVGFMVPHYATLIVEAETEEEAQSIAMAQAWEDVPEYKPDMEGAGPPQVFDVEKAW
jgi:hypothetical protein